jgi:hypothetical protein
MMNQCTPSSVLIAKTCTASNYCIWRFTDINCLFDGSDYWRFTDINCLFDGSDYWQRFSSHQVDICEHQFIIDGNKSWDALQLSPCLDIILRIKIAADNEQLTITPNKKLIIRSCARIIFSLKGVNHRIISKHEAPIYVSFLERDLYIYSSHTTNILSKIDVVLKASRVVLIGWFSLNEAPLGLFKFISDYLPYFEKMNIFFYIITKKFELIYKPIKTRIKWHVTRKLMHL